uniref:Autophagy-related protein 29 n=2 Tax=Talaromyces marneffei PM1 TaxID=1077442 RepID=A0A093VI71_TALMA
MTPLASESDVHYTVFVRLPFPRGDFIDPPPGKPCMIPPCRPTPYLSADNSTSADDFNVTLPFLLQQAAWLYDRQLSQVRAQMLKVGNTHSQSTSIAPGPTPGSVSGSGALGGQPMRRVGSGGGFLKRVVLVSRLGYPLFRKRPNRRGWKVAPLRRKLRVLCIPAFEHDKGILTVPAPSIRTNSANNVTQTQVAAETIEKLAPEKPFSGRDLPRRERPGLAILQKTPQTTQPVDDSPSLSPGSDTDSELGDDDDDSDENDMLTSRRLPGVRRFGKYSMHKPSLRDNLDDDDDDSPAFLPLARENEVNVQHMNSTLRQQNNIPETSRRQMAGYTPSHRRELVSLDSSASSGVAIGSPRAGPQRSTEPLSPRRVANLSRQSSRQQGSANQSSEETPSMGSSFSDLDDASVTQSALEEALLSNMQHGGMASRMSTISQALRSRYL